MALPQNERTLNDLQKENVELRKRVAELEALEDQRSRKKIAKEQEMEEAPEDKSSAAKKDMSRGNAKESNEDVGASTNQTGSLKDGLMSLPADLLRHISRFFDSALDLLSFSLICKRYYCVVLEKIGDRSVLSRQLLQLHVTPFAQIRAENNEDGLFSQAFVQAGYRLPNQVIHGKNSSWLFTNDHEYGLLMTELGAPRSTGSSTIRLIEAAQHKVVQQYVERRKILLSKEEHKYLGKYEGKQKWYGLLTGALRKETNYENGLKHGPDIVYHNQQLHEITHYAHGAKHGPTQRFENGKISSEVCWNEDRIHGDADYYRVPEGCEHAIIIIRDYNFFGERVKMEEWHPITGIRSSLTHTPDYNNPGKFSETKWDEESGMRISETQYDNYFREGKHEEWHKETGAKTISSNYRNDGLDGTYEEFDGFTGVRTRLNNWKADEPEGSFEAWDATTGIRTHQCFYVDGNKYGFEHHWDGQTGKQTRRAKWEAGKLMERSESSITREPQEKQRITLLVYDSFGDYSRD